MFLFILSVITVANMFSTSAVGAEVADRLDKLNNFLNGSRRNTIPDNQIMLLDLQQKYMALYSCILKVRIVELKGEMDG
jgi:hypothetical protein